MTQKSTLQSPKPHFKTKRLARLLLLLAILGAGLPASAGLFPPANEQSDVQSFEAIFRQIAPGVEHGQATRGLVSNDEAAGPWFINAIRIDLNLATIKFVRALDAGLGLETVSSLSQRHGAIAAVNGGYFRTTGPYRGESHGLMLLNGKLISEPFQNRADIGLITEGDKLELIFGHLAYESEISIGRSKHQVHGVNRPVGADELIVFTPEFHRTTLTRPDGIEVVVRRNRVVAANDLTGSSQIPADGFVISADGTARQWIQRHARRGSHVQLKWRLSSLEPQDQTRWSRAQAILGGGPQLIKKGKIDITEKQEKLAPGFATTRHPRTALALLRSGKVLLVTVDGRQPGVSVGMSLQTLAELLLQFGAVSAINLDGGGSTTMVIENKIVNRPSDQTGERPVSDAILVFPRKIRK